MKRILVIRLGALGDLVQCFDGFHAIRQHHYEDEITLLTATPFGGFGRLMPWFNQIWTDNRGRWPTDYWRVRSWMRGQGFDAVYDFQAKPRTSRYRWLLAPGPWPSWHQPPHDRFLHNQDRYAAMLSKAGITSVQPASVDWLAADTDGLAPAEPYALLVPGCSPHLPTKRWPADRYAALGRWLWDQHGIRPVLVGTGADRAAADLVRAECPAALDLIDRTDLRQLASLAAGARLTVGNDTGPVFLAVRMGCPTWMLMFSHTDPVRSAPRGPQAHWLKAPRPDALTVAEVIAALGKGACFAPPGGEH